MRLQDVLTDVDTMMPNGIAPMTKIGWINQLRRRLYRELPFDEAVAPIETVPGVAFIELPEDCPHDTITSLVIGERPYKKVLRSDRRLPPYHWTVAAGGVTISPEPVAAQSGFVYYKAVPPDLTAADLGEELDFSADYHDGVFVCGCLAKIALAGENAGQAADYTGMLEQTVVRMRRDMTRNDRWTVRVE